MKVYKCIALVLLLISQPILTLSSVDDDEVRGLVKFLLSKQMTTTSETGKQVPLSYYTGSKEDVAKYFGDYLCQYGIQCQIVDAIYDAPFAILGRGLPPQSGSSEEIVSAQSQIERTDVKYGADIYDASTWQIALALASEHGFLEKNKAKYYINNQLERLLLEKNKATNINFKYGYQTSIQDPKKAFTFRMLANDFVLKDPFYQSRYQDIIRWDYSPDELAKYDSQHDAEYFKYVNTWSDWKPILGENAWAQLIGPLQAAYLINNGKISPDDKALKNAINLLYAFSAMQSGVGGLYYAPGGSQGNQGAILKGEISLENNFSTLGGLQILREVLIKMEKTAEIKEALKRVNVLLYGGETVNGYQTQGLISFIYNGGFDKAKGIFYTHGLAKNPSSQYAWEPDETTASASMAVDVNTWGIAALGPETIDKWYGEKTAFNMWRVVREKGGYFDKEGRLLGVGYTLTNKKDNIMSSEWTAGAINALTLLIDYYQTRGVDVSSLKEDKQAMEAGLTYLRNDHYRSSPLADLTPIEYYVTVPKTEGVAYLYASKRFAIPFGWYANTLPSTTSNAWVLMNQFEFNPFQLGGKHLGKGYPRPLTHLYKVKAAAK